MESRCPFLSEMSILGRPHRVLMLMLELLPQVRICAPLIGADLVLRKDRRMSRRLPRILLAIGVLFVALALVTGPIFAQDKKPNILVIWGDDIGINNISVYNLGVMGYKTPNIDRIAKEGALFTDAYA